MKVKVSVLEDLWKLRDEYMFIHEDDDSLLGFLCYLGEDNKTLKKDLEFCRRYETRVE